MSISHLVQTTHRQATIIDMMEVTNPAIDPSYFKVLREAGISGVHFAVAHDDFNTTMARLSKLHKMVGQVEGVAIATSANDIVRAKQDGKVALIIGIQDGIPFEKDLDLLEVFHRLGVRIVQLAYSVQNYFGTGCFVKKDSGLTDLGYQAVKELNRLGILIDISHCGTQTAKDIMEASRDPVAFTHATPSALVEMGARAKSDELLKALAAKGGVVGQMIWSPFCEQRTKMGTWPTLDDFIALLMYMADVTSIDNVGLGLDVSPFFTKEFYASWAAHSGGLMKPHATPSFEQKYVSGFRGVEDTIKITESLLSRGLSVESTIKVLGGNWLRLLERVLK